MSNVNNNITTFLYNSGDVFLPETKKRFLSQNIIGTKDFIYIDGWSFVHMFSGVFVGFLLNSKIQNTTDYYVDLFIIHTVWELWQCAIGGNQPWKLVGYNSLIDSVIDTIFFLIGGFLYRNFFLQLIQ
jgi:hypothetical protein